MLQSSVDWFLYSLLGLDPATRTAEAVNFFIYDSIKILLLVFFMISFVGFLRTFLSRRKVRRWLSRGGLFSYFVAASFGALTPFCSCSSIPIFLGLLEAGVPLGVTFTFLITSPIINEYLVILMFGFFGWKITLLYVFSGLIIGIVSGLILSRMQLRKYIVEDIIPGDTDEIKEVIYSGIRSRILYGLGEAKSIVKKVWLWVIIGVGIGALIHNYVPQEAIEYVMDKTGIFSVPLAVGLGVPMYGNCAAIVPVAVVLFQKGIPLGTALAFMMATSSLSLPEAIILRRAMRLKLIIIFFVIVALAIIITGYLFNLLQSILV